jgi:hypothetical protein
LIRSSVSGEIFGSHGAGGCGGNDGRSRLGIRGGRIGRSGGGRLRFSWRRRPGWHIIPAQRFPGDLHVSFKFALGRPCRRFVLAILHDALHIWGTILCRGITALLLDFGIDLFDQLLRHAGLKLESASRHADRPVADAAERATAAAQWAIEEALGYVRYLLLELHDRALPVAVGLHGQRVLAHVALMLLQKRFVPDSRHDRPSSGQASSPPANSFA